MRGISAIECGSQCKAGFTICQVHFTSIGGSRRERRTHDECHWNAAGADDYSAREFRQRGRRMADHDDLVDRLKIDATRREPASRGVVV
ncbi:MAG: hypothetical protein R3323_08740, partial [Wenzhouxiangellaceae bacterium]|nr:hypothetical protein [Wenzhouxiangellaceae bacterium]